MSQVRIISFDGLLFQLKTILGEDSLLFQRFDFALRHRDENAIDAAMQSLNVYPESTRKDVEEAMLSWLFGQDHHQLTANGNQPASGLN